MILTHTNRDIVCIDAPAKINLFLQVLNRRPDGYHNISSLFQAVSLYDRLKVESIDDPDVKLTVVGTGDLSTGDDNLIVRAYRLMKREFNNPGGVRISLEKHIPLGAGMGGGSSDAAATIQAIDRLWNLKLDRADKIRLGLQLGSDVPFFFTSGQALIQGRGEIMEETDLPTAYQVLLINPGYPLSTAAAYAALKRGLTVSGEPFTLPCSQGMEEYVHFLSGVGNDFEAVHRQSHPELEEIKSELKKRGAALARMSGSGPTVFGLFTDRAASQVEIEMRRGNWRIYAVAPITLPMQAT